MSLRFHHYVLVCQVALFCGTGVAQEFDERFTDWPLETSIKGTIVVDAGADADAVLAALRMERRPGSVGLLADSDAKSKEVSNWITSFERLEEDESRSVEVALLSENAANIERLTDKHSIVLIHTANPPDWDAEAKSQVAKSLTAFVRQGRLLILSGAIAEMAGQLTANSQPALNLVPNAVLAGSADDGLMATLNKQPRTVGVVLKKGSAMILGGRKVRVVGDEPLEFVLPAGEFLPERRETIRAMTPGRRQRATEVLFDWTEWQRDSIERTLPQFPASKPKAPFVPNGRLVIVGGGGMPDGLMTQFVEWAGGVDKARLVYIPCSEAESVSSRQSIVRLWKRMGVKEATFLHTKDRNKANTDEEFLSPLKDATGIWFGGGRQWNFADSWYGTRGHKMMKEVLKRGGVIGGSSAGASIQARYLARATPIENYRIMAPGYERGGLGFISGVAIDQHFSQRGRQKDMTGLVNRYPQMLGIGIDESTALVVTKGRAEIVGDGQVFFYDRKTKTAEDSPDYISGKAGDVFDLSDLKFLSTDKDSAE